MQEEPEFSRTLGRTCEEKVLGLGKDGGHSLVMESSQKIFRGGLAPSGKGGYNTGQGRIETGKSEGRHVREAIF